MLFVEFPAAPWARRYRDVQQTAPGRCRRGTRDPVDPDRLRRGDRNGPTYTLHPAGMNETASTRSTRLRRRGGHRRWRLPAGGVSINDRARDRADVAIIRRARPRSNRDGRVLRLGDGGGGADSVSAASTRVRRLTGRVREDEERPAAPGPDGADHTFAVRASPTWSRPQPTPWCWTILPKPPILTLGTPMPREPTDTTATFSWTSARWRRWSRATSTARPFPAPRWASCCIPRPPTPTANTHNVHCHRGPNASIDRRRRTAAPTPGRCCRLRRGKFTNVAVTPGRPVARRPDRADVRRHRLHQGGDVHARHRADLVHGRLPEPGMGIHTITVTATNVTGSDTESVTWEFL